MGSIDTVSNYSANKTNSEINISNVITNLLGFQQAYKRSMKKISVACSEKIRHAK